MRENTNGKYPRWAVWENVPGALSSQSGQDFRCVLESLVRIKDPAADVPLPESGRWLHAGEILGDGYSLAWRVLDAAQGWGVAQRRKRIFAVLDLDGQCAGKVLFESEGVSGYCIQGSMIGRKEQNGPQGDGVNREVAFTLDTVDRHAVYAMTTGSFTQLDEEKSPPLMARDYKDPPVVGRDGPAYALDRACFSAGQNAQYSMNIGEEKAPTLVAEGPSAVAAPAEYLVRRLTPGECCQLQGYPDGWCENLESPAPSNKETDRWEAIFEEWRTAMGGKTKPKTRRQIIRWLQNPHTDSAEFKAYGNSVAVPCVFFVLAGIVWAMEEGEQK